MMRDAGYHGDVRFWIWVVEDMGKDIRMDIRYTWSAMYDVGKKTKPREFCSLFFFPHPRYIMVVEYTWRYSSEDIALDMSDSVCV